MNANDWCEVFGELARQTMSSPELDPLSLRTGDAEGGISSGYERDVALYSSACSDHVGIVPPCNTCQRGRTSSRTSAGYLALWSSSLTDFSIFLVSILRIPRYLRVL